MRETRFQTHCTGRHVARIGAIEQALERLEQRFASVGSGLGGGSRRGALAPAQIGPAIADLAGSRIALGAHPVTVGPAVHELGDLVRHDVVK